MNLQSFTAVIVAREGNIRKTLEFILLGNSTSKGQTRNIHFIQYLTREHKYNHTRNVLQRRGIPVNQIPRLLLHHDLLLKLSSPSY